MTPVDDPQKAIDPTPETGDIETPAESAIETTTTATPGVAAGTTIIAVGEGPASEADASQPSWLLVPTVGTNVFGLLAAATVLTRIGVILFRRRCPDEQPS